MSRSSPDSAQATIGRALKGLREERRITQEQLASTTGVHPTYISDIERGARNPGWEVLVKLAAGLDVTLAEVGAAYDRLASP